MARRKDSPQKAAMREMMRDYLKNNDMQEKQTATMKSSVEIRIPNAVMDVRGKESVTSTLQSIHSVRSVMSMDFWFR